MEYLIVCAVAFVGSCLTLFSGFGLGTLLIPAFGLFFPIDVTIALTAIVHFLNNIFKFLMLGSHGDKQVVIKFGVPSVLAALAGAWLLTTLTDLSPVLKYFIGTKSFVVLPVKLTIGVLLIFFALFDIVPSLAKLQFSRKYLSLGGLLSGFFGGISGMQGALRSAFLVRAGLSKEAFIGTGIAIACLIDTARLTIYWKEIFIVQHQYNYILITAATLSAFAGAYLGSLFLKKVTIKSLQFFVAFMLIIFGVLLSLGII